MLEEDTIILKVKPDCYKAVAQYMKNTAGFTHEVLTAEIEKIVRKELRNVLFDQPEKPLSRTMECIVTDEVRKMLNEIFGIGGARGSYRSPETDLKMYVAKVFDSAIKEYAQKCVEERYILVSRDSVQSCKEGEVNVYKN